MKKISTLVFVAILILSNQLLSQSGLLVTDYDYSKYPEVTFDYYVFQNSINQNSILNSNDFVILSNDNSINNKSIECTDNNQTEDNSVIISIDLSIDNKSFIFDSMKSEINMIQLTTPNTEFALSSFNTVNHLNFDFNQTYSSFKTELGKLKNSSKANIDSVFYSLPIGSNVIFQNARIENKKHLILFTDNRNSIDKKHLDKLKSENINFYLVILNSEADKEVSNYFVSNDEFFLFENIDKQKLKLVSLALKELVTGNKPCRLTYETTIDCDTNIRVNLAVPIISDNQDFTFDISKTIVPRLELNPSFYGFSSVLPTDTKKADIIITAVNSDINIDSIYFEDDKGGIFKILSGKISSSQIIPKGTNWEIEIEYAPTDSNIVFTKLVVVSDACANEEILITGGFPNTPPVVKNIEIVNPNKCNQVLVVGDKYEVTWTGLLPSDVIQLEFSTDNGVTWDTLASNVTDLKYEWEVPDLESTECLVRAIQLWPNNIGRTLDLDHPNAVNTAFFDHVDGSKAVTSCADGIVRLWNTNTGKLIRTFVAHTEEVNYAIFSPDDTKIASSSNDTNVILWDANDSSTPIHIFREHNDVVRCVNFSNDGKKLISVDKSGTCKIFDIENKSELFSFKPDGNKPLWFADFHPNGNFYLTGGNGGSVKVWDINTNDLVKEFDIAGWVYQFALNKDGSRILIVDILNKKASVWDFETGSELFTLKHKFQPNLPLNSGSFTEIAGQEYMLTSGDDNTAIMWNSVGDSISVYKEHTSSVKTAMFNFDGQRVLTASWDKTAKVWNLNERDLQMDTSDCIFTITKLDYNKNDLAFGNVLLGDYKDTTLSDALINLNKFQFTIRNAFLRGANVEDFEIYTKLTNSIIDTLVNDNSANIEIRFKPTDFGVRTVDLVLEIPGNEVIIKIEGNCTKKDLEIVENYIVFDKVDIGDFRDKIVEIAVRNNSDKDLLFDSVYIDIPRNNDYSLIMENEILELKKGRELGITARFAPQFIDRSNADIVFVHNGNNSPTRISLLGSGALPVFDTTTVVISDIEALSGEKVYATISINTLKTELKNDEFRGITFDLSFNSTLLFPNFGYTSDEIVNGIRTVRIDLEADDSWFVESDPKSNESQANELKIKELEFNSALGNDSTTTLNINNSTVIGKAKLKIFESDGTFRLLDLCTEGGARLFDASDKFNLESPSPNPLINGTYINYELLEESEMSISVSDYLGTKLIELENGQKPIGKYSTYLDVNLLPNGIYFIKLETQNQSIVRKIQISK